MWPNQSNFEVRIVFADDRVDFGFRNAGTFDTVTEMSFLYGVQWEMVSEMYSRSFHRFCSWVLALAHHAVKHPALLDAVLEGASALVGHFFVVASNSSSA
jgi:hypothetical protein